MSRNGRPLLEYDYARAKQLLSQGLSVRKVALQVGVHFNTLQGHVNRGVLDEYTEAKLIEYRQSYRVALENAREELSSARARYVELGERIEALNETIRVLTNAVEQIGKTVTAETP